MIDLWRYYQRSPLRSPLYFASAVIPTEAVIDRAAMCGFRAWPHLLGDMWPGPGTADNHPYLRTSSPVMFRHVHVNGILYSFNEAA